MLGEGILRIDLHQLAPDLSGFLALSQMAERDSEKGPREVGLRRDPNALLEERRGVFVLAGDQVGRAEKVGIKIAQHWIEPHGLLDMRDGG